MKVTVLAGGVGGSRFLLGVRAWARGAAGRASSRGSGGDDLTAVVNAGDDVWLAGVRIAPDFDTILYALAGVNDRERGWGRAGDSERVAGELRAWGVGWPWFTLGDLDLGTHLARSAWLREGVPMHEVAARLSARWELGIRLLPATDDEAETWVELAGGGRMHFQEWWTRHRAALPVTRFAFGAGAPAPGVLEAIAEADVVVLAPSNPVVSIGPILELAGPGGGIREALRSTRAPVVGVSPIIAGAVVRGMADACLAAIGVESSAAAVGRWYGARRDGGILDGWLVDEADAAAVPALEAAGIRSRAVPLWLRDEASSAAVAAEAIRLAIGD